MADNLAFFPYQCQAEPLFLIHHIDLLVSMNGSTLLQGVREALFPELREILAQSSREQHSNSMAQLPSIAHQQPYPAMTQTVMVGNDPLRLVFKSPSAGDVMDPHASMPIVQGPNPALARLEAEEESEEAMVSRVLAADRATGLATIQKTIRASRACLLLLNLKQYLKEVYGITDR